MESSPKEKLATRNANVIDNNPTVIAAVAQILSNSIILPCATLTLLLSNETIKTTAGIKPGMSNQEAVLRLARYLILNPWIRTNPWVSWVIDKLYYVDKQWFDAPLESVITILGHTDTYGPASKEPLLLLSGKQEFTLSPFVMFNIPNVPYDQEYLAQEEYVQSIESNSSSRRHRSPIPVKIASHGRWIPKSKWQRALANIIRFYHPLKKNKWIIGLCFDNKVYPPDPEKTNREAFIIETFIDNPEALVSNTRLDNVIKRVLKQYHSPDETDDIYDIYAHLLSVKQQYRYRRNEDFAGGVFTNYLIKQYSRPVQEAGGNVFDKILEESGVTSAFNSLSNNSPWSALADFILDSKMVYKPTPFRKAIIRAKFLLPLTRLAIPETDMSIALTFLENGEFS